MRVKKKVISRQVIFSAELYKLIKVRLRQLGFSAPEYIRHLVVTDVEPLYKSMAEKKETRSKAMDTIKKAGVPSFENMQEAIDFIDSIATQQDDIRLL